MDVTWEMVEAKAREMGELLVACYSKEELRGMVPQHWHSVDTLEKYARVKAFYLLEHGNINFLPHGEPVARREIMEEYRETYT